MDYGGILRRAWRITWDNKYLWWLGFLTALGSSRGFNGGQRFSNFSPPTGGPGGGPPTGGPYGPFPPGFGPGEFDPGPIIGIIIAVICVLAVIALVIWVLSIIARGGLISAANQIEDTDLSSFRQGWQAGRETMWRMLGVSLVQGIPGLLVAAVVAILFVLGAFAFLGTAGPGGFANPPDELLAGSGLILLCLIPIMCIFALVSLALSILRPFADRACVMEDEPVFAAYRRGWEVLRDNFVDSLVLGIIRFFTGLVVGFVVAVPLLILGLIAGVSFGFGALASGPEALSGLAGPVIAALVCGGLIFLVIATVVGAVLTTFFSSMWTLAYREFVGTQPQVDIAPADEPAPA